jgi:hypothetical protein
MKTLVATLGLGLLLGSCTSINTLPLCEKFGLPQLTPKSENVYYDRDRGQYIYCAGYGRRCVDGGMSCVVRSP